MLWMAGGPLKSGTVGEWLTSPLSKSRRAETLSRVQIPPFPQWQLRLNSFQSKLACLTEGFESRKESFGEALLRRGHRASSGARRTCDQIPPFPHSLVYPQILFLFYSFFKIILLLKVYTFYMQSKWKHLKESAVASRKAGNSIKQIEKTFGIPRSTLSHWCRNILLSRRQEAILQRNWRKALMNARTKAVLWHNNQKINRLETARREAAETLSLIDFTKKEIVEVILAMLYLGEGFKKSTQTGIGNSDPLILRLFISTLIHVYKVEIEKITCYLHLRADQDEDKMKIFWSKELGIPLENFRKSSLDKRTLGKKTYSNYKGVCIVRCGNVAIQRKLVYLSRQCCEKIIKNLGG